MIDVLSALLFFGVPASVTPASVTLASVTLASVTLAGFVAVNVPSPAAD